MRLILAVIGVNVIGVGVADTVAEAMRNFKWPLEMAAVEVEPRHDLPALACERKSMNQIMTGSIHSETSVQYNRNNPKQETTGR